MNDVMSAITAPSIQSRNESEMALPKFGGQNPKAIDEKTATEFAEMFLKVFLTNIMPECDDGFFGTGNANDMYKSFWIDAVAHQMSENDSFGIAEQALNSTSKKAVTNGEQYGEHMIPMNSQGGLYDINS